MAAVIRIFLLACILNVLSSCERSSSQPRVIKDREPYEQDVSTGQVVALAGGGAYLLGPNGIYLISNNTAVAITGLPKDTPLILAKIHALADGSALLQVPSGNAPGLFALRGVEAIAIKRNESPTQSAVDKKIDGGFYFAQNENSRAALDECLDSKELEYPE